MRCGDALCMTDGERLTGVKFRVVGDSPNLGRFKDRATSIINGSATRTWCLYLTDGYTAFAASIPPGTFSEHLPSPLNDTIDSVSVSTDGRC
jgi:hypothetical protein